MPTCSIRRTRMRRGTTRNERWLLLFVLAGGICLLESIAVAQIYLPDSPPEPSQYGRVILDNHTAGGPGPVVFDHWLHRSKFTCRLCHVDVGFAMEANGTGITASTIRQGFHCGACHDGKKRFEGQTIFAACGATDDKQCDRCHSLGKPGARKYEYHTDTAGLPKGTYGVDWEAAEQSGLIKPIDFVEGVSTARRPMHNRADFTLKAGVSWVKPVVFSHEKHSIWNGCELCHPEIFPATKKATTHYSMFANVEGRYCGACHGKVAFPLNNCQRCHPQAPLWAAR
jgi:c(7)-type cytochrome triheme protein